MNFFLRTIVIKALLLFILPVYGFSQEFFDDIYYNDNEVNYDFLDICNDLENDTFESGIMEKSHENYIYDEDFSYRNLHINVIFLIWCKVLA